VLSHGRADDCHLLPGFLQENQPDSDLLLVDLRQIWHCVVSAEGGHRLRGHWSTPGAVVGVADHRSGFRLDDADKTRRRDERSLAHNAGGAALAVCRRKQTAELVRLQAEAAAR
jgi:hypothetical protein